MDENKEVDRNLEGDMNQTVKDIESAHETIAKIEKIVDEARNMDNMQFLSMCRTIIQANYDLAYMQLIATEMIHERMKDSKEPKDTIASIDELINDMKDMDYIHFLAMSRVLINANYDIAYSQLNSMLKIDKIMKDKQGE